MGTGHVMRCFALAQAWQDAGGRTVFVIAEAAPAVRERLVAENMEVVPLDVTAGGEDDARKVTELALRHAAAWVVVDGYQFGADYQRQLKAVGLKLLFVDDNGHAGHYCADLVLNQNAHAQESFYQDREAYTQLLLGSRYALLRREFARWHDWKREIVPVGRRVLVTMGGGDPDNVTSRVIEALARLGAQGLETTVVIGGSNPHSESLGRLAARYGDSVKLQRDVSNMPELMMWADVAISAAGTTCWEICALGLPAILIDLAENQRPVAEELNRRGCGIHLDNENGVSAEEIAAAVGALLLSRDTRLAVSERARTLCDGRGASRVASLLQRRKISVRPAGPEDVRLLWEWASDSSVRIGSFSTASIPWEQHASWFNRKLQDGQCRILIGMDSANNPVGQIRFDKTGGLEAEIDVSIALERRGQGYADCLIEAGIEAILQEQQLKRFHAFVKPENKISQKTFERAKFTRLGTEEHGGQIAVHYVRSEK
jgi:UDP-2,4-diacetamido-2,4,6-trideoxy-beta-L-altropyranose hydrolase